MKYIAFCGEKTNCVASMSQKIQWVHTLTKYMKYGLWVEAVHYIYRTVAGKILSTLPLFFFLC